MAKLSVKNTHESYGWVAIVLHWLMALVIFFLFGLGLYMVELTYYDAWYKGSLDLHKSIGVSVFMLWCLRFIWRLMNVNPAMPKAKTAFERFEHLAAHWMHLALYLILLLLMCSGYLISTADGRGIDVFDLFTVPAIPAFIDKQEDVAGDIHFYLAWTLMAMVAVHALAAIKHQLINKDNILMRMVKPVSDKLAHD